MATGLYALSGDSLWGSIFFSSRITYHLINVLTLIGIYTMFLGFLGFWGTREKNTMLMSLYFLMLMVLFFFTITAIIVYYNKYSSKLSDVEESLSNYGNKTEQGLITTGAWNAIQTLFRCCGIKSIEDWTRHNVKKPPSPCSKSIQVQGCEMVLAPFLNGFSSIAINLLILEVLLLGAAAVALYKPLGQSTDEQWVELQEEKPIEKKKSNNFYPAYDDVRDMSAHSVVTDANKFESVRSNFSVQANKRRSNSSFYDEFVDAASRSSRSPRSKSSIAYDIADDTGTRLGKNKRSQNSSVYNKPAGSGTTTSGSYPLSNYIEAISGYAAASSLMKNNPLHDLMNTEQKNKYHYQPRTTKSFTTGETTSSSRPNMAKRTSSLTDVYTVLNVLEAMSSSKMFRT